MSENTMRKLPIGVQTFEDLRKEGYVYVDKTEHIYKLTNSGKYFFLSRPRRFGKSLLLSTIGAYYEGKKELFEGLAIAKHEDLKWEKHPVLHIDLNTGIYKNVKGLREVLNDFVDEFEMEFGCKKSRLSLGKRFEKVIRQACEKTGQKVVILVDEYDKPMLEAIENIQLQDKFRDVLKDFYGGLKSMDRYIEFAMLTGVTKFGKMSVFSGLNNLKDISMDARYSDICGITEKEIRSNLKDEVSALAKAGKMTRSECVENLRTMYDGYHFVENVPGVYNPFSVLNALDERKFGSYWFDTATPSFLAHLLQKHSYNLSDLQGAKARASELYAIDSESSNPIPVIYQSGYLTIKGYDPVFKTYVLGFPNQEVEEGFIDYLMPHYIYPRSRQTSFRIDEFVTDIQNGKTEQFMKRLKALFKSVPYDIILDRENHFQSVMWMLCTLMGLYTKAEYKTCDGRIDMVIKTPLYCYVMEFKYDGTAEEAIAQIEDKEYALPFELEGQKVIKIGVNFDSETKNIEKYIVK